MMLECWIEEIGGLCKVEQDGSGRERICIPYVWREEEWVFNCRRGMLVYKQLGLEVKDYLFPWL